MAGPRAALRVTDVLLALSDHPDGVSLDALSAMLEVPRASLYRLLRELESANYIVSARGGYRLGDASMALARQIISLGDDASFQVRSRPHLRQLASETSETVMLGIYDRDARDICYVEVIDSTMPVRFTVPVGHRRPLHSAASGKTVFCLLEDDERQSYLEAAGFPRFTQFTSGREELEALVPVVRRTYVTHDFDGSFVGASACASPILDTKGKVIGSVSVAGPTDRIRDRCEALEASVFQAGQLLSRLLGYSDAYPREDHAGS